MGRHVCFIADSCHALHRRQGLYRQTSRKCTTATRSPSLRSRSKQQVSRVASDPDSFVPSTRSRRAPRTVERKEVPVPGDGTYQNDVPFGPQPPSGMNSSGKKPEWVRILEEDADKDEEIAKILEGTEGDPAKITQNMQARLQNMGGLQTKTGVDKPPKIVFREMDPFELWVWMEFYGYPGARELEMLDTVLRAWYVLGKLGAYNGQNLQVHENAEDDNSFFEYQNEPQSGFAAEGSVLHEAGELETRSSWARVRIDMGTADEIAIDLLLNALIGFSKDYAGLKQICVGGENRDWMVPERAADDTLDDMMNEGIPTIDPMSTSGGMLDEYSELDEVLEGDDGDLQAMQDLLRRRQ